MVPDVCKLGGMGVLYLDKREENGGRETGTRGGGETEP